MTRLYIVLGLLVAGFFGGSLAGRIPVPGKVVLLLTLLPFAGLYLVVSPC